MFPFKILLPIHPPIHVCLEPLFCTRDYSAAFPELPELGRGHGQHNRPFYNTAGGTLGRARSEPQWDPGELPGGRGV